MSAKTSNPKDSDPYIISISNSQTKYSIINCFYVKK